MERYSQRTNSKRKQTTSNNEETQIINGITAFIYLFYSDEVTPWGDPHSYTYTHEIYTRERVKYLNRTVDDIRSPSSSESLNY